RAADEFADVLRQMLRWVITLSATVLLAHAWSLDTLLFRDARGMPNWSGRLAEAAATVLVGWYLWRLFATGLALRLSREEAGPQSRAYTVQPLLRAIGKFVIAAVVLMSALSSLGFNIAPLLASAGVVGIAVGFGAQTLVRDLFSGACYLIEDVFRIGDYIEG